MRRTIAALATIAWGLSAVACGSEDAPAAEIAASGAATPLEGNRAPILRDVRIQPEEPAAGQLLRAVVWARDPEGDAVTLTYHWELGSNQPTPPVPMVV